MKRVILGLAILTSTSSFAEPIDTICLSSVSKEHNAPYTLMMFDLDSPETATRTEIGMSGEVISSKKLSILGIEALKSKDGSLQYVIMDDDADFYICSQAQ